MPTYGYECTACSDKFEIQQSIKDNALTICDKCGGALKKLIYPIGIAFKGSGFYVNDYAPKSSSGAGSSTPATTETAAPSTPTETKTETKTETPAASTPAPAPAAATA